MLCRTYSCLDDQASLIYMLLGIPSRCYPAVRGENIGVEDGDYRFVVLLND